MNNLIQLDFNGHPIQANNDAWFNATDAAAIFNKAPNEWLRLPETKRYIKGLNNRFSNTGKSPIWIKTKRGNNGGTWLHRKLAIRFAQWLDIDFAIWCDEQLEQIISNKQTWGHSRQEASIGYQVMSEIVKAIKEAHGLPVKQYHFINEALLCNWALTGKWKRLDRDSLPKYQLDLLTRLEARNAALLAQGLPQPERKIILKDMIRHALANYANQGQLEVLA